MRSPDFWRGDGWLPTVLAPAAAAFNGAGRLRRHLTRPYQAAVPVVCIGNLVVGGAGKTPLTLALAAELTAQGLRPHLLTRGYGGRERGPLRVDPAIHDADMVGDEALLLAQAAPTWIAADRAAGAAVAAAECDVILMDDGLQNPTLRRDLALLVIDGGYGFGNGRVMPAGPLREALAPGLGRVQAAILIGEDRHGTAERLAGLPLARARLQPVPTARSLAGTRVLGFAGIGRPEKFFETLRMLDADIVATKAFPDHHRYGAIETANLIDQAAALNAVAVTTTKDWVRLPPTCRDLIRVVPVELVWQGPADRAIVLDSIGRLLGG
ncbi:MAG TPA: tetraacyldisaccharide 4'-kinase [Stellaceae bacterium]|nr:tetraacyldisaccharide 4'-kinase [Stellaceae bacterium]